VFLARRAPDGMAPAGASGSTATASRSSRSSSTTFVLATGQLDPGAKDYIPAVDA